MRRVLVDSYKSLGGYRMRAAQWVAVTFLLASITVSQNGRANPGDGAEVRADPAPSYYRFGATGGIELASVDGRTFKTIVERTVLCAAYDSALELLWFVRDGKLSVVDLRADAKPTIVVATSFPAVKFEVTRDSHQRVRGIWNKSSGAEIPGA